MLSTSSEMMYGVLKGAGHQTWLRNQTSISCGSSIPTVHLVQFGMYCTARQYWPICQNFGECSIINLTFIGFEEISIYWSVFFLCVFPHVAINRQTSHDSGSLRQDYELVRGFIGHCQSANLVYYGIIRDLPMDRMRLAVNG